VVRWTTERCGGVEGDGEVDVDGAVDKMMGRSVR